MNLRLAALLVVAALGVSLFFFRPAGDGGDLRAGRIALFEDLSGEYLARIDARKEECRRTGEEIFSELPDAIRWEPTVYDAIERAKREDKPIFLMTFVRENGDPHCDV